jgi:hypothetical protein
MTKIQRKLQNILDGDWKSLDRFVTKIFVIYMVFVASFFIGLAIYIGTAPH